MASRPEIKIKEIFEQHSINFIQEYEFEDLKTKRGNPLRFDFAVFDDDDELLFLLEYQGEQHYFAKDLFGGENQLRIQKFNDLTKKRYCKNNHIKLICIPYQDELIMDYDYIMKLANIF